MDEITTGEISGIEIAIPAESEPEEFIPTVAVTAREGRRGRRTACHRKRSKRVLMRY